MVPLSLGSPHSHPPQLALLSMKAPYQIGFVDGPAPSRARGYTEENLVIAANIGSNVITYPTHQHLDRQSETPSRLGTLPKFQENVSLEAPNVRASHRLMCLACHQSRLTKHQRATKWQRIFMSTPI